MGSVLRRSLVVATAASKARWASDKVFVAFPFAGDLALAIAVVVVVGKLLKRERRERRLLMLSLL